MKHLPAIIFLVLIFILFGGTKAFSVGPGSGDSNVNASVNNPSITATQATPTPTFIFLSSTPTPVFISPTVSPTLPPGVSPTISPTATPTLAPGVSATPTPTTAPGTPQFYLDISGFASPNASIVMTSGGTFIRATVASSSGNFYISQIKVSAGFSQFCLENIDFKRIGDSITCFEIPPVTENTSKTNIFLPPSLGLSAKQTSPSSKVNAFGYTMPGSSVNVQISEGIKLSATADKNGFFNTQVKDLAVGTYELFATATYHGKPSEKPSKTLELKSLSGAQIAQQKLLSTIWGFLTKLGWIVIPILILIIILLVKKIKDVLVKIKRGKEEEKEMFGKNRKHLHHYYFVGY